MISGGRQTAHIAPQRRRNRSLIALTVAPRSRPAALRELYRDAGTIIRHAAPTVAPTRSK